MWQVWIRYHRPSERKLKAADVVPVVWQGAWKGQNELRMSAHLCCLLVPSQAAEKPAPFKQRYTLQQESTQSAAAAAAAPYAH